MEFKHQNVQEVDLMHPKGGTNDSGCNCTINANYGIIYTLGMHITGTVIALMTILKCTHYPICQMNVEPDLS